ncbi:MAG: antibiotic biosynthesis monooxygenase [Sphingomonas bacterium]|uniref:putative quinol monooxygenase n=1 Tax=Sphingomonas bacterium TaxID=1895847 RepID=UPI002612DADA|nr:putative quinol monooxygenase [Sphingomonas bacterium]MDB5708009.1 antibiotic biosynthesis monooxygenase [Sphingomonas bacterium]
MIIVTGSVTARGDSFEALREASLAHVHRSRLEDGCVLHSVQVDCENPLRLFFYEQWRDMAALKVHFAQPGSHELMKAVREHAAASENITMFEATAIGA